MRYFLLIASLLTLGLITLIKVAPVYDLSIERSLATASTDGRYIVSTTDAKNIWYIGAKASPDTEFCVEWKFDTGTKKECADHDGANIGTDEIFSFPVITDPTRDVEFRITGVDPSDITVYSLNTQPSRYALSVGLPQMTADSQIISRQEWGADETLRYSDHPKWVAKRTAAAATPSTPPTAAQIAAAEAEKQRLATINTRPDITSNTVTMRYTENGHKLVWPIQTVKKISRIVVHHTADTLSEEKSDMDMIRGIYAYHTLSRGWGDIGYNYLVGKSGQIYEGRAGGDYVVAGHATYNNMGTVGISVMGDFNKNTISPLQRSGLESAITMMAQKYGITLSDQKDGFIKCLSGSSCFPLKIVTTKSLLTHQDVAVTDCPGTDLYRYIPDMITRLDRRYDPVLNPATPYREPVPVASTVPPQSSTVDTSMTPIVYPTTRYLGPRFKVRLSYPDSQKITLSTADGKVGKVRIGNKNVRLSPNTLVTVEVHNGNDLIATIAGQTYTGSNISLLHSLLRINSWERIPDWDTNRKYNDNLFRDTIRLYNDGGKLLVVNELPLEWYLKGMGEVSNGDLPEKIKTIVVAARSYAKFYMSHTNRKYSTSLYDGSDDPDQFQKYLGYGYEARSPNVAKIVDATVGQVITYSGILIKPWYHSSSDGRTLSAREYCLARTPDKDCPDIPYLQSVDDPGGVGRTRSGHGVGISGIGATYWAKQGWDYKQIIPYYLSGVTIEKKR